MCVPRRYGSLITNTSPGLMSSPKRSCTAGTEYMVGTIWTGLSSESATRSPSGARSPHEKSWVSQMTGPNAVRMIVPRISRMKPTSAFWTISTVTGSIAADVMLVVPRSSQHPHAQASGPWAQDIGEAVAQEIDAQDEDHQEQAGERRHPPRRREMHAAVVDQSRQRREGLLDAETQEGQSAFRHRHLRKHVCPDHQQLREHVGQEMPAHDPDRPRPEGVAGMHELALSKRQDLAACDAGEARPAPEDQNHQQIGNAVAEHCHHRDGEDQEWKRELDVDEPHQRGVGDPTGVAGDEADDQPQQRRRRRRDEGDEKRDAETEKHTRGDAAT